MLARYKNKDMLLNIAPHPLVIQEVSNMQFPADDEIWTRGVPMTEGIKQNLELRRRDFGSEFSLIISMKELCMHFSKASACWGRSLSCSSNAVDGVTV